MADLNGNRNWIILLSTILAAGTGSGGGVYAYMKNIGPAQLQTMARPDPATGSEVKRIQNDLQNHLGNHPDTVNKFDRRITRLETKIESVIQNQLEILRRLNRK